MKKNPQQNKLRIGLQTRKMRKTEKGVQRCKLSISEQGNKLYWFRIDYN